LKFKGDKQKEGTKFLLEGHIEAEGDSQYLKKNMRLEHRKMRISFIFLVVVLISALVVLFVQQYLLAQKNEELGKLKFEQTKNSLFMEPETIHQKVDSLRNRIVELKLQNDRLAEFIDLTDGVFFEVWISGFEGFDATKYQNEHSRAMRLEDAGNDYLLARFRDLKNALLFENDLKRMGVQNATIKGRINGLLTDYKVALKHLKNVQH
jgi:hypothetical protein